MPQVSHLLRLKALPVIYGEHITSEYFWHGWQLSSYTKPTSSGGGSSGGGGGGGGASGENYTNIEVIEKYDMQISKDVLTSYRFTHERIP